MTAAPPTAAAIQRRPCAYGAILATIRAPIRARHACGQCRASRGPAEQTNSLFSPLQALTQTGLRGRRKCGPSEGGRCAYPADLPIRCNVLGTCGERLAT